MSITTRIKGYVIFMRTLNRAKRMSLNDLLDSFKRMSSKDLSRLCINLEIGVLRNKDPRVQNYILLTYGVDGWVYLIEEARKIKWMIWDREYCEKNYEGEDVEKWFKHFSDLRNGNYSL